MADIIKPVAIYFAGLLLFIAVAIGLAAGAEALFGPPTGTGLVTHTEVCKP